MWPRPAQVFETNLVEQDERGLPARHLQQVVLQLSLDEDEVVASRDCEPGIAAIGGDGLCF
jgi:hypothetical protein